MTLTAGLVKENLEAVHNRIADAGGDPEEIRVVAVTKGFAADAADAALAAGLVDLGENYAQELRDKSAEIDTGVTAPRWHFIGRLQSNKVRMVAPLVTLWQSVDRESLVREIARRSPGASVLVQVNAADEEAKGGCDPEVVPDLVSRAADAGLDVQGLMTVGVAGDRTATASAFAQLSGLADTLSLPQRSMGMTADIDLAVKAGTTMVRVGTALFGARPGYESVSG